MAKNKVGAPVGNTNAEKYDIATATSIFERSLQLVDEKEGFPIGFKIIEGYSYDFIGEIAAEQGLFKEIFAHLVKRFPELQPLKNELDTKIERNCYSNTKKGLIREATGIVNLKSNWGWTDRQRMDHTGIPTIPIIKFTDDHNGD